MTRAPKGLRYPLPSSGVDGWKARAEAAEKEVERLKPFKDAASTWAIDCGLARGERDVAEAKLAALVKAAQLALDTTTECGYGTKDSHIVLSADAYLALESALSALPPPVPTEEGGELGLHPATSAMVDSFALALKGKLRAAEVKYGHGDSWRSDDWADKCRADLMAHVQKGDPRDVAAYAAFCWAHGWSTTPTQAQDVAGLVEAAQGVTRAAWTDRFTMLHGHPSVAALETALAAFQSRQEGKQP